MPTIDRAALARPGGGFGDHHKRTPPREAHRRRVSGKSIELRLTDRASPHCSRQCLSDNSSPSSVVAKKLTKTAPASLTVGDDGSDSDVAMVTTVLLDLDGVVRHFDPAHRDAAEDRHGLEHLRF